MRRGVRISVRVGGLDSLALPRSQVWFDGDANNNHAVGVFLNVNAECIDPFLSSGFEVGATPNSIVGRLLNSIRDRTEA